MQARNSPHTRDVYGANYKTDKFQCIYTMDRDVHNVFTEMVF